MITEDYVSFETAKLLKEKGFGQLTYACFAPDGEEYYGYRAVDDDIMRPTLQMAMKWLREVHKIHISVEIGFDVDNHQYYFFFFFVCKFSDKSGEYENPFGEKEFDTNEEACETVIKYVLENLI